MRVAQACILLGEKGEYRVCLLSIGPIVAMRKQWEMLEQHISGVGSVENPVLNDSDPAKFVLTFAISHPASKTVRDKRFEVIEILKRSFFLRFVSDNTGEW